MSSQTKTKRLVLGALFAALACVATLVIRVPSPFGYANLGDCIVLLGAFLLGPVVGALAGGIGAALADLIGGYVVYAPATFIIKAIVALVAGLVARKFAKRGSLPGIVVGGVLGELCMIAGYFGFNALILGNGWAAAGALASDGVQAVLGVVLGTVLFFALSRIPQVRETFSLDTK